MRCAVRPTSSLASMMARYGWQSLSRPAPPAATVSAQGAFGDAVPAASAGVGTRSLPAGSEPEGTLAGFASAAEASEPEGALAGFASASGTPEPEGALAGFAGSSPACK